MSIKKETILGLKWTSFSTVFVALLQIAQISILTKFLSTSDFGLMAIVMMIIGFSNIFIDMGIGNAIIYQKNISHKQLSTLYWVNVITGLILFIVISLLSPFIADFYNEIKLTELIIYVSFTLFIQSFGQLFNVLWQKKMLFNNISKLAILKQIITFTFTLFFAYKGNGVYSIVIGLIAGVLTQTIFYLIIGIKEFKPSFYFKISDIYEFTNFGLFQMAEKTLNYISAQFDTIIIGKLVGVEALGIYNVVKQLITKPIIITNSIFNKVIFPMFSKIQENEEKIKIIYMLVLKILSILLFPLLVTFYFYGYEIAINLLGNQWLNSDSLIKLFSVYLLFIVYGNPIGTILLAKGKANWALYSNIFIFILNPIAIIIFTNYFNLNGAVLGSIFVQLIIAYPYWKFLISKLINVSFFQYYKSFIVMLLLSFISFGSAYYISKNIFESIISRFSIFTIIGLTIYILSNLIFDKNIIKQIKLIAK